LLGVPGYFSQKDFISLTFPSGLFVGSSIPELGNAINDTALNPLFASVLIPL